MSSTDLKSSRRFRVALRRVGRLQYWKGNISSSEWSDIRSVVWKPTRTVRAGNSVHAAGATVNLIEELIDELQVNLIAGGQIEPGTDFGEIDWDSLLAFIKELLPMIMEFIQALLLIF